jgi:hypothetical protein
VVVEMPDHRMVSIQPIEPSDHNDPLVNNLLENNPSFRALVEKSKKSPQKAFLSSGK